MTPDLLEDHQRALTVACPMPPGGCGEPAGQRCTRVNVDGDRVPLEHFPAHIPRLKAAGVIHAPWDARDLRRGD